MIKPFTNGPNGRAVNALAGNSTALLSTQQINSKGYGQSTQCPDDLPNPFNRLARQFKTAGFGLYPLSGETLLVSSPTLGLSRTLPDLRAAQAYLRQIARFA
jgi:hypothetical protein